MKNLLLTLALGALVLPLQAQLAMPPANATAFRDTSMLKPPADAKVAIVEFEDLECGYCARYAPLVRGAAVKYKVPLVHFDYIIPGHAWSRSAAINARYLEDKVSPRAAEAYRMDVFANKQGISSKDDLDQFTRRWFQAHGQQMPFVPLERCVEEVQADCTTGDRLGVRHTPTLLVVTAQRWIEVTDPVQLYAALDVAREQVSAAPRKKAASTAVSPRRQ